MEGAHATEETVRRTGMLRNAQRFNFKSCSTDRIPELAGKGARNAQWIRPNG